MLEITYPGEAATLSRARHDVLACLRKWGADESVMDRAALIVSELATNALQASPGSEYGVQISRVDSKFAAIAVRNTTSGTVPPPPEHWQPVDHTALRGRGLSIVSALSDDVTVENLDGEVIVTALIRLS
jgi:anti-sigma regulatory factor (Ser/Thr protein kinase)